MHDAGRKRWETEKTVVVVRVHSTACGGHGRHARVIHACADACHGPRTGVVVPGRELAACAAIMHAQEHTLH
jgi:hypothetical protein